MNKTIRNLYTCQQSWRLLVVTALFCVQCITSISYGQITIGGSVFGGAREADVEGDVSVNISDIAPNDINIDNVFGGNDVSGAITGTISVTTTYKTTPAEGETRRKVLVGNLFGGGNGDYDYTSETLSDGETPNPYHDLTTPDVTTAVTITLHSGCFGQVFGGGNNATITPTGSTTILINNLTSGEQLDGRTYQFNRVFGGNNKAEMAIQPTWGLTKGSIRDLYSGGNAGHMTYKDGISLTLSSADMTVYNVYGGCRMANVSPTGGESLPPYGATVTVTNGKITNVYGGNDISGLVSRGTHVDIQHTIIGDVYGGGNGSYVYTDNSALETDAYWGDYYYSVPDGKTSDEALTLHRPNVEKTLLHLSGTSETPTYIGGAVYCGGNSATLRSTSGLASATAELKIGSHVIADNVFMGSNGVNMVSADILAKYQRYTKADGTGTITADDSDLKISTMNLTVASQFEEYMRGVEVGIRPTVSFDDGYTPYSTKIGSFYCGGNVGSMSAGGTFTIDFLNSLVINNKLVGGCNNANVPVKYADSDTEHTTPLNAEHKGGLITATTSSTPKVRFNINGLKLEPRKQTIVDGMPTGLVWNIDDKGTTSGDDYEKDDLLVGANIYGGCYQSGYVNGDVEINLLANTVDKETVFSDAGESGNSGIPLAQQGVDPLGTALNVFGGGYGEEAEIWGNTTINVNGGYTFQVFGGGEMGKVIGAEGNTSSDYGHCTVNLNGGEVEYLYGGGFEGDITGHTTVNLGGGTAYDVYGGACNAGIGGYTEVIIGRNGSGVAASPTIRHGVYGGNDLGGTISGTGSHTGHSDETKNTKTYVKYLQGIIGTENEDGNAGIFGGNFGNYDYVTKYTTIARPHAESSFVDFRPESNASNMVKAVFGGSLGYADDPECNVMQQSSYVLVEAPSSATNYANMDIYGGGAFAGMGYVDGASKYEGSGTSLIDLYTGQVQNVYGGCNREGLLGYARINVPETSTIKVNALFGGGKGYAPDAPGFDATRYCDTYITLIDYKGENARVEEAIYGGNHNCRVACDTYLNITVPVKNNSNKLVSVFGAGLGRKTVSGRTHVYLNDGAQVNEVYGGGSNGNVFNYASLTRWLISQLGLKYPDNPTAIGTEITKYGGYLVKFGNYLNSNPITLPSPISTVVDNNIREAPETPPYDNTNVYIKRGATVENYAFGGGMGEYANVCGTTNIQLLGGTVKKDLYGAGYGGPMEDEFQVDGSSLQTLIDNNSALKDIPYTNFNDLRLRVKSNVYVAGGTCRNVFGGGYQGNVGYRYSTTDGSTTTYDTTKDILGETHVTIGIRKDQATLPGDYGFYNGVPAIKRNAYGGGEGGAIFGTAYLTMNNGYIGYEYNTATGKYTEKLDDETWSDGIGKDRLVECGNIYGAGYDDKSSTDFTHIKMYGGTVRNCLLGGGEIATVGRGKIVESGEANSVRVLTSENYHKAGGTHIEMYNGHVKHNVFGGGKGYNSLGYGGSHELYTDGYVFGSTEVLIHGGEIGTAEGLADGYGNVFGGGDIGYVYSKGYFSKKTLEKENTTSPGHIYYYDSDDNLTEDCRVVIAPYLQAKNACRINGHNYAPYEYVPTDDLNTLPKKSGGTYGGGWTNLDAGDDEHERGIIIHNAVFAGGNVSSNSDKTYANAVTVFGNSTATLYDVYHRDFITVGTEHTGGLYGGGNLSLVGGYRELNITNYGTDYYSLDQQITLEQYKKLSNRERSYFSLQYVCERAYDSYIYGQKITEEEYNSLDEGHKNTTYWKQYGFCSIYAGRLLNTIQRADMCGVYGSRMVLQGAKDRVVDVADATEYTINRVGELSLNKQSTTAGDTGDEANHGNYFGIYNMVHYLGNLTSDVTFDDKRKTVVSETITETEDTYYQWKSTKANKERNRGYSHNQVALASGVYLELTTENSTGPSTEEKDYGYVTGIIELALINVKKETVGGGYIYAKNEHRVPKHYPNKSNVVISEYNKTASTLGRSDARTYKRYLYDSSKASETEWTGTNADGATVIGGVYADFGTLKAYETSGNFIHRSKHIVDDCYPTTNAYDSSKSPYSKAHYWYVKGEVYIYDQVVSAYTGSASAYDKEVQLPLTITAAGRGRLKLLNIQPNLYAYWADEAQTQKIGSEGVTVNNESETYHLNDVISYWDWNMLSDKEKKYFIRNTYVNALACTVNETPYAAGENVMDETAYTTFKASNPTIKDGDGKDFIDFGGKSSALDFVFRTSNNIGHDTGYVLTFDLDSPADWDDWYSVKSGTNTKISKATYGESANQSDYLVGPSYRPTAEGKYGDREHSVGQILTEDTYNSYTTDDQANAEPAYIAKTTITYTLGALTKTLNPGTAIGQTEYDALTATEKESFARAYVCTETVKLADDVYILYSDLLTLADINNYKDKYSALITQIENATTPAYICTKAGTYGGQNYSTSNNYKAIDSWCILSATDRAKFEFNNDALDLLLDGTYAGNTTVYDTPYCDEKPVEYYAKFVGTTSITSLTYNDGTSDHTLTTSSDAIPRETFEQYIPNEQRHYVKVTVKAGGETVYIANSNFLYGDIPIAKGEIVKKEIYDKEKSMVDEVTFANATGSPVITYYCFEDYSSVTKGTTIDETTYIGLPNKQKYFVIQGKQPMEKTTLYVSRESDIRDVTQEKIITVIYQYTYDDDDSEKSSQYTNELHVVNIHLQMKSGTPEIGTLLPPSTVLPGNAVGMKAPTVKPGLYEVLTSGWEIFDNPTDAVNHLNGTSFENNKTPVYWYQNGDHYIAFYSKTYLGKTYSNPVALSVANYHDIADIMERQQENHLYIDRSDVDRPCKIYINDYSTLDADDARKDKNGLDELKRLFDLSVLDVSTVNTDANGLITTIKEGGADSPFKGHAPLNTTQVGGCKNLEIIMRTDVDHSESPWTPIGESTCFEGRLHGDGHTISGLAPAADKTGSLFGKLCGDVYNLGVTGSFTGAGVADEGGGYVENCWISTTATTPLSPKPYPVFGNMTAGTGTQLVNSYYPDSNKELYNTGTNVRGTASQKTSTAFGNGEVAYDLNGFYLYKRYNDHANPGGPTTYKYYKSDVVDSETGKFIPQDGTYASNVDFCSSGYNDIKYVEDRFDDGDFIYAGGSVPTTTDVRYDETDKKYYPIWPDDYLFFGQTLTYGHVDERPHQPLPAVINKIENRLPTATSSATTSNRVYRAPAYFRDKPMSSAYFNPNAVFAATKQGDATTVHQGMTAIDFTGGNGDVSGGYKMGLATSTFYPPLLDDDGIFSFEVNGLTKNLLVYTKSEGQTASKVSSILTDKPYAEGNGDNSVEGYVAGKADYRTVAQADATSILGHWVQLASGTYIATNDHLLVDKEDFLAPIGYTFATGKRMWYQRTPDNYVDIAWSNDATPVRSTQGWEGISLPFVVDIVTTQTKGELTHFYGGSTTGHEYWLREFTDGGTTEGDVFKAKLTYPAATGSSDDNKEYTNTFLWDYYYSKDGRDDYNRDDYQQYYSTTQTYGGYPRQAAGAPYLVGFPSKTYYEFDLSGEWTPQHRYNNEAISSPGKQTITFASKTGVNVPASSLTGVTYNGYTFTPSYLNQTFAAGTANTYVLNATGSSYDKVSSEDAVSVSAFRPYFTATAPSRQLTRSIVFSNESSKLEGDDHDRGNEHGGILDIHAKRKKIVVASTLSHAVDVRIVNTAGITLSAFTVEPGENVETRVSSSGVYIVHTSDARYTQKLSIR